MSLRLLVSMGRKRQGDRRAPLRPVLVEVDADRRRIVREVHPTITPAHTPGPMAHQELTAASWGPDGRLWQGAHTEVLRIDPQTLGVVGRWSHPRMHSVHSATPTPDGGVVVTSSGTDSVLEFAPDGSLQHVHALTEASARRWPRDAPTGDLRRADHNAFKPHAVHPNHALWVDRELWITCFETRCAVALPTGRRIPLPEAMPHDGRLRAGQLWFTQVTGRVVAVDPVTLRRTCDVDLSTLSDDPRMLGWCRGIERVGQRLFVGFTMLRRPRHREVLRLLVRGIRGEKRPTRVVEIDLDGPRIVGEIEVGNAAGGTIYAISALPC